MGKFDEAWKVFFSDNRRFADIMNIYCYQGRQIVKPEDVKEADIARRVHCDTFISKIIK